MKLYRIIGILLQELFITRHSFEVILDIFYFSIINIIVFGFVSLFLTGQSKSQIGEYIIMGMILWEIIRVSQYTLSLGSLWEIWSKNLSNLFVTPLNLKEYLGAEMFSGAIKALIVFFTISFIGMQIFHFNIFQLGPLNLVIFFINLVIFSWAIGLFLLGLIFRFGTRIQAFAWSLIFLFQPLCATLFPLRILPQQIQYISYMLPPTYVFEAARQALITKEINWQFAGISFCLNIIYFILSIVFFNYMFNKSKETGQFARNES